MASWGKASPIAASAALLIMAFPPGNLVLLVFVALVPWLWSLREADGRAGARSGALLGAFFFGYQMFWLIPFVGKWTGSQALATIPWAISVALQVPYFMLLGWLVAGAFRTQRLWMIPLIWPAIEVLRSFIPVFAFPHGFLAMPLWTLPSLMQLAGVGTVYLVSAWIVFVNLAMVVVASDASKSDKFRYVLAPVLLAFLGFASESVPRATEKKTYALGQIGEDLAFGNPGTEPIRVAAAVRELVGSALLQRSDALILPEGIAKSGNSLPPTTPFPLPMPLPTLFGGQRGSGPVYQSSFVTDGQKWDFSDKTRLVIFGEFVPFRDQLPFLRNFNLPSGDLVPAKDLKLVELAGVPTAPVLCFEAMFADIPVRQASAGARLVAVMSIDDWFVGTHMMEQLASASAYRAVESGLPLVRVGSLGTTAAWDHRGRLIAMAPLGKRIALRAEVQVPKEPQDRRWLFGFPIIACLLTFGHLFALLVQRNKPVRRK